MLCVIPLGKSCCIFQACWVAFKDYSDDPRVYPDEFDEQVLYPLLGLKAHLK